MAEATHVESDATPAAKKRRCSVAVPANPVGLTPAVTGAVAGQKISMREVARLAKVSVATVSMVLNDNPRISRATHMRVQRLIDRLGYRPNRLAQSLSGRYTQVLAVL